MNALLTNLAVSCRRRVPRFRQVLTGAGLVVLMTIVTPAPTSAQSWLTARSYYSHDLDSGQRVNQFYNRTSVVHTPSPFRSVYRHTRSSLQIGDSVDQYHAVDRYGEPVRPYGEWRFPFRPFSVPYPLWGPVHYGGFGGGYPSFGYPRGGGYWGPFGPSGVINGAGFPPPWNDGSYPDVLRTQLPPQPFPTPTFNQSINNEVTGDDNVIQNQ